MRRVVVYSASPGPPAEQIVNLLRSHDLSPATLDPVNPDPNVRYASAHSLRVHIAVPASEVRPAVKLLKEHDARGQLRVERIARELRFHVLIGFAIACAVEVPWLLLSGALLRGMDGGDLMSAVALVIVGTTFATVIVNNVAERRRRRREMPGMVLCETCDYPLIGLSEPRCPECGQAFDPKLLPKLAASADVPREDVMRAKGE